MFTRQSNFPNFHRESSKAAEATVASEARNPRWPVADDQTTQRVEDISKDWPALLSSLPVGEQHGGAIPELGDCALCGDSSGGLGMIRTPSLDLCGSDEIDLDGFSISGSTSGIREAPSNDQQPDDVVSSEAHLQVRPAASSRTCAPHQITDLPSFLITTWFTRICPMWSAFDSETNMNRKIAQETWPSNEAVFYSLQSMAAAYMAEELPHLGSIATLSARRAVQAIRRDLPLALTSRRVDQLSTGLCLSLICLGTSRCWSDSKQIGLPFLREMKLLLQPLNQQSAEHSMQELQTLSFFNNSCFYWDMLCGAVSSDRTSVGLSWQAYQDLGCWSLRPIPHPWTGVSATAQRFFASAVSLCRRFHGREKRPHKVTACSLQASLQDIEEAVRLEEQIRSLKEPDLSGSFDTGDTSTPGSHLVHVSGAYRLAALLQLYMTFDDLTSPSPLNNAPFTTATSLIREFGSSRRLSTALSLLQILESIPPDSGSRSIQPILYLTAGVGLRFDDKAKPDGMPLEPFKAPVPTESYGLGCSTLMNSMEDSTSLSRNSALETSLNVGRARHFVMIRFDSLEQSLPSRPIKVAKELMQAIWASYDSFPNETHWLDVMERTGLYTIFG